MAKTKSSTTASSSNPMDEDSKAHQSQSDKIIASENNNASMKQDTNDAPSSSECPLFMDGLPSDFAANPGLAAIASLLNDEEEENETEKSKQKISQSTINFKTGGGKVKKTSKRNNKSPYDKQKNKDNNGKEKKKASLGEAQLFLNMWKI